MKLQNGSRW